MSYMGPDPGDIERCPVCGSFTRCSCPLAELAAVYELTVPDFVHYRALGVLEPEMDDELDDDLPF